MIEKQRTVSCPAHVPDLCVIEILRPKDYACFCDDGYGLVSHLQMLGYDPQYIRAYTFQTFKDALRKFKQSRYRFLHISCHGGTDSVEFWDAKDMEPDNHSYQGTQIPYDAFSKALKGCLGDRRVTFSACELGNKQFVQSLIKYNNGFHSVVAPTVELQMHKAAVLWRMYYGQLLADASCSLSAKSVKSDSVVYAVQNCSRAMETPLACCISKPHNTHGHWPCNFYSEVLGNKVLTRKSFHMGSKPIGR